MSNLLTVDIQTVYLDVGVVIPDLLSQLFAEECKITFTQDLSVTIQLRTIPKQFNSKRIEAERRIRRSLCTFRSCR